MLVVKPDITEIEINNIEVNNIGDELWITSLMLL